MLNHWNISTLIGSFLIAAGVVLIYAKTIRTWSFRSSVQFFCLAIPLFLVVFCGSLLLSYNVTHIKKPFPLIQPASHSLGFAPSNITPEKSSGVFSPSI